MKWAGGMVATLLLGVTGVLVVSGAAQAKSGPTPPTTQPILTTSTRPVTTTAAPTTTTRPITTTTRPATTTTIGRSTTTGATTTSSSTVVTIPGGGAPPPLPAPTSTIPLNTHESNGHVSPVFPAIGIFGAVAVLAMLGLQWYLTRSDRRGGWTL